MAVTIKNNLYTPKNHRIIIKDLRGTIIQNDKYTGIYICREREINREKTT